MASSIDLPSRSKWVIEVPHQGDSIAFGGCRSIEKSYTKSKQIGKGTYGEVFLGRAINTAGPDLALKKIRMENEKEGFPITAIREIKLLKRLKHENVICLKEIVRSQAHTANNMKGSIYMVFDYMDHDLTGYMERMGHKLDKAHAKSYIMQLLKGLHYCHHLNVLHRDLKLSNLLVDNHGKLKIADFGLARVKDGLHQEQPLTNKVITLWYRPPELLLGSAYYGKEIDIWSVGCIMVEILTGKPLFPGGHEAEQLALITKVMGTLNKKTMGPDFDKWSGINAYNGGDRPNILRQTLQSRRLDPEAIDLVSKLLALDPNKRITAEEAVKHQFFWSSPSVKDAKNFPNLPPSHEKDLKDLRQHQKQQMGPGSSHGKRSHSQVDGGAAYMEAGPSQRQRTDTYAPPDHSRAQNYGHPQNGMHAYGAAHAAGSAYQEGSYGQYNGNDPYAGGYHMQPHPPAQGRSSYTGQAQHWQQDGSDYYASNRGRAPPHQDHASRGTAQQSQYGVRPTFLNRKR